MLLALCKKRNLVTRWDSAKSNPLWTAISGPTNNILTAIFSPGGYMTSLTTTGHSSGKWAFTTVSNSGDVFFGFCGAVNTNTWMGTGYIGDPSVSPPRGDGVGYETYNGTIRFHYDTNPPGNSGNPSGVTYAPAGTVILNLFDIDNGIVTFWDVAAAAVAATYTLNPAIIGNGELWFAAAANLSSGNVITAQFSGITLPPAYASYNNHW